jgi:hypothetical protein
MRLLDLTTFYSSAGGESQTAKWLNFDYLNYVRNAYAEIVLTNLITGFCFKLSISFY